MNISRRKAVKFGGLAAILAAVGGTVTSCGQNALNAAGIVLDAFRQIQPILAELVPNAAGTIAKAIKVAADLQTALRNKAPEAIDFLKQLVAPDGLFNQILEDLQLVTDPAKKRMLTLLLIIAQVALTAVATALHQDVPTGVVTAAKSKGKAVDIIEKIAASNRLDGMLVKF